MLCAVSYYLCVHKWCVVVSSLSLSSLSFCYSHHTSPSLPQPAAKRAGGGKRVTAPCGRIGSRKSTVIPCYTSMKALTQLVFSSLAAHRSPDSSGVQREAALAPLSSRCQVGSCGGSLRNLGLSAMLQGHLHSYALNPSPPPSSGTRA